MAGRAATLVIQVVSDTAKAADGIKVFGKQLDTGLIAKGAAVAGAVGLATTAIIGMTKAAADDAAEQDRLLEAVKASGAAHGDYAKQLDVAIEKGQALAFTDTQIRDALVPLVGATGDVTEANALLATAQDVARLAGVDLETASKAVAKAHNGSAGALAKLTQTSTEGKTAAQVLTEAQRKAAGQAEAYGKTTKGQTEAMSIGFDELTETIGAAFLPILADLIPVLMPILKIFGELIKALLPALIPLVKLLIIPLKILVTVIGAIAEALVPMIEWIIKAIETVGDFLAALGPVQAAGEFIGGIFDGKAAAAAIPAGMAARSGFVAVPGSVTPRAALPAAGARAGANVTVNIHGAVDPEGTARQVQRLLTQHGIRMGTSSPLVTGQAL